MLTLTQAHRVVSQNQVCYIINYMSFIVQDSPRNEEDGVTFTCSRTEHNVLVMIITGVQTSSKTETESIIGQGNQRVGDVLRSIRGL